MKPRLELRCGCVVPFVDGDTPTCPTHGVQGVARTLGMPKPRFTGAVTGPVAQTTEGPAWTGKLKGKNDA